MDGLAGAKTHPQVQLVDSDDLVFPAHQVGFHGPARRVVGRAKIERLRVELSAGVSGITDGAEVTLCVRPEDVVARDISADSPNALRVEIDDMEFLGSFYRANLIHTGGVSVLAEFSINLVRDQDLKEGRDLFVTLPESRIHIFPGS